MVSTDVIFKSPFTYNRAVSRAINRTIKEEFKPTTSHYALRCETRTGVNFFEGKIVVVGLSLSAEQVERIRQVVRAFDTTSE